MPPSKGKNKHPSASHASLSRLPIFRKHRRREKRRPPIHCRRRRSSSSGVPGARSSRQRWMLFWHRRRSGPRDGSRGRRLGRLWLSEASMVGAGIRPGCLVSVSLISSSSDQLDAFPLVKLFEECNRFFDLDLDNDLLYGEAGKNFMVSTVFPLREVPKNGIKLSWDIACVLGHPLVDRLLFISPLFQAPKRSDDIHILRVMKCLDQRVGIAVVVATNRPDKTDPALLRPGRFDRVLDVQPSNEADRADIFRIHTCSMPCRADMNLKELARLTEGYTGADIKLICREAAVAALDERFDTQEVAMRHFKSAISRTKPSDVKFFQELAKQFRRSLTSLRA